MLSFVPLLFAFAIFYSFMPAFAFGESVTYVSLIFFPDGFYLVFLEFCLVGFLFLTSDFLLLRGSLTALSCSSIDTCASYF